MPSHLVLIAMLSLHLPWGHGGPEHIGAWTLKTHTDQFTGRITCHLSRPKVDYRHGALVLHLSRATDTSAAVYRIDWGQPISVREDDPALARLGFTLYTDDLDNPSGGLVRIPEARLMQAQTVSVEPTPGRWYATFKIDRFAAALEAAHRAGCAADGFE